MKGKRRRRFREGCKTLLIVLLSCSAVFLASQTLLPSGSRAFLSRFSQPTPTPGVLGDSARSAQTLQPAAFAVTWEEGRYAVLYHQEDQEGYTRLSALLSEALNEAAAPAPITAQQWELALTQPGVFCEYLSAMPLDSLNLWLSNQENPALAGYQAQRLCVTARSLYFAAPGETERYFFAPLDADLSASLNYLSQRFSANGARFACEDGSYPLLRRDALVLSATPSVPRLQAEIPFGVKEDGTPDENLNRILQLLSFHPQTNPLYAITGGYAITDGGETLRVTDGLITYQRTDDNSVRFPADAPLDATRALAEEAAGVLAGDGRLYLHDVSESGGVTTITYSYAYRGAAIQQGAEDWCAKFTVEDGAVTALALRPRRYTVLEEQNVTLLPQEQAAAIVSGRRSSLVILYEDALSAQEQLTPFWATRTEEGR